MRRTTVAGLLCVGLACGGPSRLETVAQVDGYVARGDLASACAGFAAPSDEVRLHTARRLAQAPQDPKASACLAEALYDPDQGQWDPDVAGAVAGSRHPGAGEALAAALDDDRLDDKAAIVRALGATLAPSGADRLAAIAVDASRPSALRAAAVEALQPYPDASTQVVALLKEAGEPEIRVGAARALAGRSDREAARALVAVVREDDAEAVRLAAVKSMGDDPSGDQAKALCEAMISDTSAAVRESAVRAFKGTKSQARALCLAKAVAAGDDAGSVREALLDTIKTSPAPAAAKVLCEEIGPWVRRYGKDKIVYEVPGGDIVGAQNFRDFERSYECVEAARRQGGYSCFGRNYLAHWINDLGGSAKPPHCPGRPLVK